MLRFYTSRVRNSILLHEALSNFINFYCYFPSYFCCILSQISVCYFTIWDLSSNQKFKKLNLAKAYTLFLIFVLDVCGVANPLLISSGIHLYNPLLKLLEEWSVHCIAPSRAWFFLPYLIFTKIKPKMEYCWAEDAQSLRSVLDRVQKSLHGLVKEHLFSTRHPLSPQPQICKTITTLFPFPWQMFT